PRNGLTASTRLPSDPPCSIWPETQWLPPRRSPSTFSHRPLSLRSRPRKQSFATIPLHSPSRRRPHRRCNTNGVSTAPPLPTPPPPPSHFPTSRPISLAL